MPTCLPIETNNLRLLEITKLFKVAMFITKTKLVSKLWQKIVTFKGSTSSSKASMPKDLILT